MKKASVILLGSVLVGLVMVFAMTGCKPEDTEPPVIGDIEITDVGNYKAEVFPDSVKGAVLVSVTATDNVGIDNVIFLLNDEYVWQPVAQLGDEEDSVTVENDVYSFIWDTWQLNDNVIYAIRAVAADEAGNTDTSAAVSKIVRIPNEPPNEPYDFDPPEGRDQLLAYIDLGWFGDDPDTLPKQVPSYVVFFGTSSNLTDAHIVDTVQQKTDTARTTWSTRDLDEDGFFMTPETDYYWKIRVLDPYGLYTDGEVLQFSRGENRNPTRTKASLTGEDSIKTINYPPDGIYRFTWLGGDPDLDEVTYRFYIGQGPDWDNVSLVTSGLTDPLYEYQVSANDTYYWRPMSTDMWGLDMDSIVSIKDTTPPETNFVNLWRLIVEP